MKISTKSKINKLVFLCAFTYFISYITRKNFSTIIVAVSSGTGVSQSNLGLALTGTFITYGIGQLISGFLGDRFQPKKLVALGLLVTIIANICLSLCGANYVLMTVLWCINGFAQAFMWPPIVKLMTDRLSDEEYKKQTQKISWGSTFATIFLYLACPLIISLLNWESVFYFSAIIGIVGLIYWWVSCPIIELKREEKVEVSSNNKIKIRNYLCGCIDKSKIKHAYIPEILGKEKRKTKASKEGTLGVEGVSRKILEDALKRAGVLDGGNATSTGQLAITKLNLYEDGLIGGENSAVLRRKLLERLSFPKYISTIFVFL